MNTLLIGGGCLGRKLALHYRKLGPVDVISRTLAMKTFFENHGCRHFARDITNPRFKIPATHYDRVILNTAVTVDARSRKADDRLCINGTTRLLRELHMGRFKGKLMATGCENALSGLSHTAVPRHNPKSPFPTIDEESLLSASDALSNPFLTQIKIWQHEKKNCGYPFVFILLAGLYEPGKIPFEKLTRGLRVTSRNPRQALNFIHAEDAARAVIHLEEKQKESDLFFVSDESTFTFETYSRLLSREFKFLPLIFTESSRNTPPKGFRISNEKLKKTGFKLKIPKLNAKLLRQVNTRPPCHGAEVS
jgi:nucleoside-diphosphate-sugar epimerase